MALRLIGTDDANPRLPVAVINATQGPLHADLAPGDVGTLAVFEANAYTDQAIADVVAGGIDFADGTETLAGTSTVKAVNPAGLAVERPYVDVRSYGAVGDGVADDTAAIQTAINAAAAIRAPLMLVGTHRITATLTSTAGPINLVGRAGARLVAATASFNMIELDVAADGSTFRDITFQGAATDDTTTQFTISHPQPSTPSANNVRIVNCRFIPQADGKAANNGVKVFTATDWLIDGCLFQNLIGADLTNTGYGILTGRAQRIRVVNNSFRGDIATKKGRHAVYMTVGTSDCLIANNVVSGFCRSGLITKAGPPAGGAMSTISCNRNVIIGNTIVDCTAADVADQACISIAGGAWATRVIGNVIDNCTHAAINVLPGDATYVADDQLRDIVISANTITNCDEIGVELQHTLRCHVTNNRIHNTARVVSVAAITLRSDGNFGDGFNSQTRITGNYVTGVGRASVEIGTGGTRPPTGHVITDNDLVSGTTGNAIQDTAAPARWVLLNVIDNMLRATGSMVAFDTTPSVKGYSVLRTLNASTPTTITALDDGVEGQQVDIVFLDGFTTVDFTGTTLFGNGGVDWKPANGDRMRCVKYGANWYCDVNAKGVTSGISGANTTLGFYGTTPIVRPTVNAAATDATTTQALANSLRTALINLGLVV